MHAEDRKVIVSQWRELRDYTRDMVEPLTDEQMVAQPIAGITLNHPAWILSHLSAYGPMLAALLKGEPAEDPINSKFGMGSEPSTDSGTYLPRLELLSLFTGSYDDAGEAFLAASDELLNRPIPFERWRARFPTLGYLPTQFFLKHSATHLGQLSAWRRAMGMPPV